MRKLFGFTLIELMITIAVVAILATIAMPMYSDYIRRSKISEAVATLSDMRVKMDQYFLDNRTYNGSPAPCTSTSTVPLPTGKYFTYSCPTLTDTTYTIQADGIADEGMSGFTYTINQNNEQATVSVPDGWTLVSSCWVTKKDGSC